MWLGCEYDWNVEPTDQICGQMGMCVRGRMEV